MRKGWLLVILLCGVPAVADKNRREAEKLVAGVEDALKRVGSVQRTSAGHRGDMSCSVSWAESVLVTDKLGCKMTISQTGSNVQICTRDGSNDKSIVSNQWDNKISFDLGALNSSAVGLQEKKDETLNDFPNTSTDKIYQLTLMSKRGERVIAWSSKLKYISRSGADLTGSGDVRTDHQQGVWEQFAFGVSNQTEGERLVKTFSQAMDLCSSGKK